MIKKRDEYAQVNWDVEQHARSVLTGRTQEEIARNLPARKGKRETARRIADGPVAGKRAARRGEGGGVASTPGA